MADDDGEDAMFAVANAAAASHEKVVKAIIAAVPDSGLDREAAIGILTAILESGHTVEIAPREDVEEAGDDDADLAVYREAYARLYRQWWSLQAMLRGKWTVIDDPDGSTG